MKRLTMMALAAATALTPLAMPTTASAQDWRHRDRYDDHRRGDDDRYRDRDHDGRNDRWDRHDNRRDARWDRSRHNGYTYNGRWYYGAPPAAYYGRYEPGYREWRRGDRLPAYYRNSYRDVDWRYYRLREPPRGYHWVRDDRGEYLLVGIATGVILGTILSNNY
ncbi:MAG: RcnB family protein [Terricaulis sp.]